MSGLKAVAATAWLALLALQALKKRQRLKEIYKIISIHFPLHYKRPRQRQRAETSNLTHAKNCVPVWCETERHSPEEGTPCHPHPQIWRA